MGLFNQTATCVDVDYENGAALLLTVESDPLYVVVFKIQNYPKYDLKAHVWIGNFSERRHLQIRTKSGEWPHSMRVEIALKTSVGHIAHWVHDNALEWNTKHNQFNPPS